MWSRRSVTLKLVTIGFLILILLIPKSRVESLIYERQSLRDEAIREVSSKWGGQQTLAGPVISVPFTVRSKKADGTEVLSTEVAHFLPDTLMINGELATQKRYRGIYVVALFEGKFELSGSFGPLNLAALPIEADAYQWQQAVLNIGVADMKGIRNQVTIRLTDAVSGLDTSLLAEPGLPSNDLFPAGLHVPLRRLPSGGLHFSAQIDLNGSSAVHFLPLGKVTQTRLQSDWANPSLEGTFLPNTPPKVSPAGFVAEWQLFHLNRNYSQQGIGQFMGNPQDLRQPSSKSSYISELDYYYDDGNTSATHQASYGVKLLVPVDEYQKTNRSVKYGLLFICLSFVVFFFMEIHAQRRLHAIHYLLVGFAIVLFYVLLLSTSEHMRFLFAYLLCAALTVGLISFYLGSVFRSRRLGGLAAGVLLVFYLFFYSLLQLQEYSLLVGSLGLFGILATLMYLTRRLDWFRLGLPADESPAPPQAKARPAESVLPPQP